MALRGPGGSVRGGPRRLREVPWDAEPMRWPAPALVAEAMGEPAGGLMGDETGFGTKGTDAVGVARQSGGARGTVEQGQVGGAGPACR